VGLGPQKSSLIRIAQLWSLLVHFGMTFDGSPLNLWAIRIFLKKNFSFVVLQQQETSFQPETPEST